MVARVVVRFDPDKPYGEDEVYSEREYEEYVFTAALETQDSYGPTRAVLMHLFVDDLTGIVVFDVEKYEKSLKN